MFCAAAAVCFGTFQNAALWNAAASDARDTVEEEQEGSLLTGFQIIDGSRYLFTEEGDMCTGCYTAPDGEKYCFTEDGRQYLNSVMPFDDGYYYYFGEDGKVVTGDITFTDGRTGMTDSEGHLYVGCHRIGDTVYSFTSEGRLRHTVDATKPMVALTYDDGPSTENTQVILDTLTANGAYATFFVLGRNVDRCAELIQRIEDSGSEIGNHTYNHYKIPNMDAAVTDQEISSTSSYVQMITGNRPCIMRPPTGETTEESCTNVAAVDNGYPLILWSIDTADWKHRDAATTCETIRTKVKDGSIVLMHDMEASSAAASQIIIPELIAAGYQLVTVSELAAARGGMEPGKIYHSFDPGLSAPETELKPQARVRQNASESEAPEETKESAETQESQEEKELEIRFPWLV